MIEIEKSRKKSFEAFKNVGKNVTMICYPCNMLLLQTKHMAEGPITKQGNQVIETNVINMVDFRDRFKIIAKKVSIWKFTITR